MVRVSGRVSLVILMASACSLSSPDRLPTGSQTIVSAENGDVVYAVNADEGSLSRLDVRTGELTQIAVGKNPSRVARSGDRLFVTLQGEAAIAVVTDDGGQMSVTDTARTGSEPVGVVTSRDGKFVYVAVTLEDVVQELDAVTLEVLRSFPVMDQPTWLALHPSGERLYVGSAVNGEVTIIDLGNGNAEQADVPVIIRDNGEEEVDLDVRITGDITVSADGETLAAPGLYVDATTPIDAPTNTDEPVVSGYGSSGLGVSRMNPALITWELDADGDIEPHSAKAIFLGVQPFEGGGSTRTFAVDTGGAGTEGGGNNGPGVFRSMPTSAAARPDSDGWVVTMEGSDAVLLVSRTPFKGQGDSAGRFGDEGGSEPDFSATSTCSEGGDCTRSLPFVSAVQGGFWERPIVVVDSDVGPRGITFTGSNEVFVHSALGRTIAEVPAADDLMADVRSNRSEILTQSQPSVVVAESALSPEAERGRLLFHSATDPRMASFGAGVSCSTCHYQGRSDGIVWTFADGPRNTMTLAGGAAETAPFTWLGGVESIAEEAFLTSQGRMGGVGITTEDLADIEAFVTQIRQVDAPRSDLAALGEEIFNRADVGCATCHVGATSTDNEQHLVIGFAAQTPTLRGIAATAPYFHDGSARTLRDVLEFARTGNMGDTGPLTEQEMDALEAYLRSM